MNHICKAQNLVIGYSKGKPVNSVPWNFSIPKGKITALLGPNGSGKTTLLSALMGTGVRISGMVTFDGYSKPVHELSASDIVGLFSFVPQEPRFPGDILLGEYLRLAFLGRVGWFQPLPEQTDSAIQDCLVRFKLSEISNRPMAKVSQGERQRAALARAFLQGSEVMILDEPTNHLDVGGVSLFWSLLRQVQKETGTSVILSTHSLEFAEKNADWVIALGANGLVFVGEAKEFFSSAMVASVFPELRSI